MKISTILESYINKSIARKGSPGKGKTIPTALDNAVYKLLKTVKISNIPKVPVNSVGDFVYNLVLASLKKSAQKKAIEQGTTKKATIKEERLTGYITTLSIKPKLGWLKEENKQVFFESSMHIEIGKEYKYIRKGTTYTLVQEFEGYIKKIKNMPGGGYDTVFRFGEEVGLFKFSKSDDSSTIYFNPSSNIQVIPDYNIWHKSGAIYAYFNNKVYTESSTLDGADLGDTQIDCSAYMFDESTSVINSYGQDYDKTYLETVVSKVLFYGIYRFIILTRELTWNIGTVREGEVSLNDILILNTLTKSVVKLGPTHSNWAIDLLPFYNIGYTDIQINKSNGKLLLLKSDMSPTLVNLNIDYYAEDPLVYHSSENADIYRVGFTLDEVILNGTQTDFTIEQNIYTHDGIVTSMDSVSVVGGVAACMFTQQPETFNIYINRLLIGFKQAAADPYKLVALGLYEFYDVTEATILYSTLATSTGLMEVAFLDPLDVVYMDTAFVSAGRLEAIQTFWPSRVGECNIAGSTAFYDVRGAFFSGGADVSNIGPYSLEVPVQFTYDYKKARSIKGDRFTALTDDITEEVKFIWSMRRTIVITATSAYYHQQGMFFFKYDADADAAGVLDSIGFDKDQLSGLTEEVSYPSYARTQGVNICHIHQISKSEILFAVSRVEDKVIFNILNGEITSIEHILYDAYTGYIRVTSGALSGLPFDVSDVTEHVLTETVYLPVFQAIQEQI